MSQPQYDAGGRPLAPEQGEFAAPAGGYYAEPPPKQRGCFFYGCLFAAVGGGLALLLLVALAATTLYFANQGINQYTSESPVPISQVSLTDDQKKDVQDRWGAFKKAVENGENAEIVLTADDINSLIESQPELKGTVYIKLKDEKATGEISYPVNIPLKGKRYINGTGTITAELADGKLDVRIQDLEVNGKQLPPEVKTQLGSENIAKDFTRNPKNAKMISKIESVKIKDSKVYIKAKKEGASEAGADPKTKADDAEKPKAEAEPKTPETTPPAEEKPKGAALGDSRGPLRRAA